MRTVLNKKRGWKSNRREFSLLGVICLLALLVVSYVGAQEANEPGDNSPNSSALEYPERSAEPGLVSETNYALQFDGFDDFARVVDIGNFDFDTTFTVEAWVNPDSVTTTGDIAGIVSGLYVDNPLADGGWLVTLPAADHSQWGMSICNPFCVEAITPVDSLVVGEWKHIAATYDGTTMNIYQDAALISSQPHTGDVPDVGYLFMGAFGFPFQGTIDEVRVWNVARSQQDILSTVARRLAGDEPGLVGYWPLDDGAGQFAADATGNGQQARLGSSDAVDSQDPAWVASDVPLIPPAFLLTPFIAGLGTDIGISSIIVPGFHCGWSPGETVEIWWDRPEAELAQFTVDDDGCFEGMFNLDDDERISGSEPGVHEVQARGSVTGNLSLPFEQVEPQLHLSPPTGPALMDVAITGCGWAGSSTVNVFWQQDNSLLARPQVSISGCISDTLTIPRAKDGIYGLLAFTDEGLFSAAGYWVSSPTIILTPPEGPPGARVPLAGCSWFPHEQIEFNFAGSADIFETAGTSIGGCITTGGPTEPTLTIPLTTTLGTKIIEAKGVDSGLVVNTLFDVIDRSLVFDPVSGFPGDPVAVSGCGWVGNNQVTIEWGWPDSNNQPILWVAVVDTSTGCFGLSPDTIINVPLDTNTGELTQTATGDNDGQTTAPFTVVSGGYIEIPDPSGDAGNSMTVDIFDAIVGESISFIWNDGQTFDGVGVGGPATDLSYEMTLPIYASVGNHTITAEGTRGFFDQETVTILDNAQIAVATSGEIFPGDEIRIDGTNWAAGEIIQPQFRAGLNTWIPLERPIVPADNTDFSDIITVPSHLPPGPYTLAGEGDKGREAQTPITISGGRQPIISLNASYADPPPDLDGVLLSGEWDYNQRANFENGFITARSDESRLYILLDLLADNGNDGMGQDNFWLTFDVLNSHQIDPGFDLNFRLDSSGDLILQEYTGPNSFAPRNSTFLRSAYGSGFNCSFSDGTLRFNIFGPPYLICNNHRVWEIGIDLATIDAEPGDDVRIGIRSISQSPSYTEDIPANFTSDFSQLGVITLAPSQLDPNPPSGRVQDIGSNGFEIEVTQAVQDVDNSLRLVADKDTVARVYPQVAAEALVRVFLFGEKDGLDLPGSPLVTLATVPASINRELLDDTANFVLPASWVIEGTTNLVAIAENLDGQNSTASQEPFFLYERPIPTYWIVPINAGSAASPMLPSNARITAQESYLEAVYPVPDVSWVRRPWQDIGPNITSGLGNLNNTLNDYYTNAAIAYIFSIILTGQEPFPFPDQIYGFTSRGGGLADGMIAGGTSKVASGFFGTSQEGTLAHEINHNLDPKSSGTWGWHVVNPNNQSDTNWGCGAPGPDSAWPRTDDEIAEVGFDTRQPWSASSGAQRTVVPDNYPDFMSYCQSEDESNGVNNQLPTKWISPYRWRELFGRFGAGAFSSLTTTEIQSQLYYISGQLNVGETGSLDPIVTQPGIISQDVPAGDYIIEIQNSGGQILYSLPFTATFTNIEGEEVETVYFHYQLPFQPAGNRIVLKHLNDVLDTIVASENPPLLVVTTPGDGDSWSGQETIGWVASDADGDPLQFSILYSPDEGMSWYPVASNLDDNEYSLDVGRLPGGTGGKIRVTGTDGFHTVEAQSTGTFTVPHSGPIININTPVDGQSFVENEWINLEGRANSVSGDTTETFTYIWSLNGEEIEVGQETSTLPGAGEHTISLSVYDEYGNFGETSVTVTVSEILQSNDQFLPLIRN